MQLRTERKAPQRYRDDEVKTVVPAPNMARSLDSPWKMPPPVQFNPNLPPATLATLELGVLRPSIITNAEPGERHHSNQPQRHTSFESSHDSARIRTVERHQDSHPGSDDTYDGINPISPAVSEAMGFVAVPASEREVQWHMLAMPLRCQILLSMRGEPMGETDLAIRTRFSGQQIDEACASLLDIEFVFDPRKIRSVLADDALKISISELDEVKAWMLRYSQREIQETSALTRFRKETLNILLNYTGDTIPANYFRGLLEKHTGRFRRQESNLVTQHELLQAQLFLGERGLNPTWAGQWTIPSAGRTLYSLETALSESPLLQHDETAYPKVATRNRDSSARPWTSNTSSREASQPEELSEGHAASNPNEDVIGDDGTDSQSAQAIYQTARESVKQTETIEDAFSLRNSLLVNASVASSTVSRATANRP